MATSDTVLTAHPSGLLANRNFVLLWAGQFVSQFGDRFALVAFPWLIYQSTESAFSTGAMLALYTLPYVLFGSFAGVFIDRFNKRYLMISADLVRAGLVAAVPFVAARSLPGVFALSFVMASVAVFFDPCKLALLPDIVTGQQLIRANSLLAMGETLTEVVGYSAAGFIAYYFSTRVAFFSDAMSFLVSAVALLAMVYTPPSRAAAARESVQRSTRSMGQEMREGLAYLRLHAGLRANTILVIAAALGLGAAYPLTFLLAVRVLGGGARSFGMMEAAIGLGYLIGSAIIGGLGERVRKGYAMTVGLVLMGNTLVVIGTLGHLWAVLPLFAILGAANAAALISIDTFVQQTVPEELRGRVWGTRFALTQGFTTLSILVGGALAGVYSVSLLFIVAGMIVAIPGLVGLLVPHVRNV